MRANPEEELTSRPRMGRLDWCLMIGMAVLVPASAAAAYWAGRFYRDYLLSLPLISFWLVLLIVAPMWVLGACGPQYRGKRPLEFSVRGLVSALVLSGLLFSTHLHHFGRVEMLKAMFTREVVAAIRSGAAASLATHPDELNLHLFDKKLPDPIRANIGDGWRLDIQRAKWGDPPRIRLWAGNHMTRCGIVMVGLDANANGDAWNQDGDDDTTYLPWLDGSMLMLGRDD